MASPLWAFFVFAFLVLLSTCAHAISATGQRVLVVFGSQDQSSRYSTFLNDLEKRGFQISQRRADESTPKLSVFDERRFDHIVFLADDVQKPAQDLAPQALVDFNKDGGNIVFAYSPAHSDWLHDLARQYSLEIAPKGERLVDHFRSVSKLDDGSHSTIAVDGQAAVAANDVVFSAATRNSLRESLLLLGDVSPHLVGSNPLALPLVSAPSTSYTAKESDGAVSWLGSEADLNIISAFQLKDSSSRVTFIGSKELLTDSLVKASNVKTPSSSTSNTANAALLDDLTAWTFQETGVLKVERRSHYRVRTSPTDVRESYEEPAQGGEAAMYRIKDTVRYSLDIAQHTREQGWVPAPKDLDIQVSLIMIDPFITATLAPQSSGNDDDDSSSKHISALDRSLAPLQSNSTTRYTAAFQLPDRLGVYTFRKHWRRPGWTFLDTRDVAPVRAFNHDEGPRFLPASWPYAAASFSTVAGFLAFTLIWLLSADKAEVAGDERKKTQ